MRFRLGIFAVADAAVEVEVDVGDADVVDVGVFDADVVSNNGKRKRVFLEHIFTTASIRPRLLPLIKVGWHRNKTSLFRLAYLTNASTPPFITRASNQPETLFSIPNTIMSSALFINRKKLNVPVSTKRHRYQIQKNQCVRITDHVPTVAEYGGVKR